MTTSRSIINTIGFAFVVAGLPPMAIALGWLIVLLCIGLGLLVGGALADVLDAQPDLHC